MKILVIGDQSEQRQEIFQCWADKHGHEVVHKTQEEFCQGQEVSGVWVDEVSDFVMHPWSRRKKR